VRALRGNKVADGTPFEMKADLVLLAMGFLGPEKSKLLGDLDVQLTERGTVWRDDRWMTSAPGVFAAGDMQRGQSLIVWAIHDGRRAAAAIATFLAQAEYPEPFFASRRGQPVV
jgi:glutamate synthase (NADPH/NADH) small chain